MFAEKLTKLLGSLFRSKPQYVTVAVNPAGEAVQALPPDTLPKHVAIIMDGNGRWATKRGLPRSAGHAAGVEALRDVIRASDDWGIQCLTIYAFSTENWARSKEEVGALMGLILKYFASEIDELDEKKVRITILGDVSELPEAQRDAVVSAMERTKDNTGLRLNIALNYGGRVELVRAAKLLAEKVQAGEITPDQIDAELFASQLYTAGQPDVDLLIRTSGELRLSNFLPWQSAYAEMVFDRVLWPDFDRSAYLKALREFASRNRRFGGVKAAEAPEEKAAEAAPAEEKPAESAPVEEKTAEPAVNAETPAETAEETPAESAAADAPAEKPEAQNG